MKSILTASVLFLSLTAQSAIEGAYNVTADSITKDSFGTQTLSGRAELKQGAYKLTANAISINQEMGSIVASGNCQFDDGQSTLKHSQMIFKVENGTWKLVRKK